MVRAAVGVVETVRGAAGAAATERAAEGTEGTMAAAVTAISAGLRIAQQHSGHRLPVTYLPLLPHSGQARKTAITSAARHDQLYVHVTSPAFHNCES